MVRIGILTSYSAHALCAAAEALEGVLPVLLRQPSDVLGARLDGVIVSNDLYNGELREQLEESTNTRWIHCTSAGTDNLARYGIPAGRIVTRGRHSEVAAPVSEHAVALLLALMRRLPEMERDRAESSWRRQERRFEIECLRDKTVLLIGLGRIGGGIARRLRPFEVRLIGLSRAPDKHRGEKLVDRLIDRSELLSTLPEAHCIVTAIPLTSETRGLLSEREIDAFRRGAYFVNVGRGGIVNEDHLVARLSVGELGGVALDVFEDEPLSSKSALWQVDGLLITPHVGGAGDADHLRVTVESALENVIRLRDGAPLADTISVGE